MSILSKVFSILSSHITGCCGSSRKSGGKHNVTGSSILFPLYIYPDPGNWDPLYEVLDKHPDQHFTLVINPNSGPGSSIFPDAEYTEGISKLNKYKNVTLIGYVHTSYGTRDLTEIINDVEKYASWSTNTENDIHMDGIFVDEAPGEPGIQKMHIAYMKSLHAAVRKCFYGHDLEGYLVTNPGIIVDRAFYSYADVIVSYEASFKTLVAPDTLFTSTDKKRSAGESTSKQCALIHSFDGSKRKQSELVQMLVSKGIGEVFISTSDPGKGQGDYNRFSDYWKEFVAEMERANLASS